MITLALFTPNAGAQTPIAATAAATHTPPAPDPRAAYVGSYVFVGGARERNEVLAAIDRAIAGMSFFAVPFARSRLRDRNPAWGSIAIRLSPGVIEVQLDARALRTPDTGANTPAHGATGDAITVSQRFDANNHLVQVVTADRGGRRTEFTLAPDGTTLTMAVTITSSALPRAVRYSLTFRRR